MFTINRQKESSVAPISINYRAGNTATQDYDAMKKEIIAAVKDEMRRDTQQNAPPHRQDTGTGFIGNTQYPRRESWGRNLRTTDGQPICNGCRKVGHMARYCRESGMANDLLAPTQGQYIHPPQTLFHNYQFPPTPPPHFGNNAGHLYDRGPSTWGRRGARK